MKKLLIIDDHRGFLELLQLALTTSYDVRACTTFQEAIQLDKEDKPDLIISDYHVNLHTAPDIVKDLLAHFGDNNIPVILISGSKDITEKDANNYYHTFIEKPFPMKKLRSEVENLLS